MSGATGSGIGHRPWLFGQCLASEQWHTITRGTMTHGFSLDRGPAMPGDKQTPVPNGSPTIAKVLANELCSGCGLCAAVAGGSIRMAMDKRGFARPEVVAPVPQHAETQIASACPGAIVAPWRDGSHPYWGPIDACATGHAIDDMVRFAGSSGGMLSALAIHALEQRLVDAVVHVSADPDAPLRNITQVSRTAAEIVHGAGSRYGPSPMLEGVGPLLDSEERFLLIGKPCDISAMRQLGTVDSRVEKRFVFMLSFFCGGMPSLLGTRAIVAELGLDPDALAAFRYRGEGWPGLATAVAQDGTRAQMSYARSWGDFLSGKVQYRCKICPDAVGGAADIACADAWYGGESGYPQFDEQEGRSLVLTRTAAGKALLAQAVAANAVAVAALPVSEIDLMQPAQARRKRMVVPRSLAARLMLQGQPTMRSLGLLAATRQSGLGEWIRNLIGSIWRIAKGRR
jgi:coenzyme F420 hydrogenase subunit beta